jgi:alpha-tubulin suppressor-like RCC1 family protein
MKSYAFRFSICLATILAFAHPQANGANTPTGVLTFGSNSGGRTGLGTTDGNTLVATPIGSIILGGRTITLLDAGGFHSLMLVDDGTVFSFGQNSEGVTGQGTSSGNTLLATPIIGTNLGGTTIVQVAASGGYHSLLLADDGTVFSFGRNLFGATGRGTQVGNTLIATPVSTTNLGGRTIKQVAAGGSHSLLLADDGTVYSFGLNDSYQTGLGTQIGSTLVASPIDTTFMAGKKIKQVSAGSNHSLLLAEDGTVFSFGTNRYGRTGQGTSSLSTITAAPIDSTNLVGKTITQIAAGGLHSLLLADDGSVFSFGLNRAGTGLGTDIGQTLVATPIDSTNLSGKIITQIAAGYEHSILLADDGTAFSFGWNGNGQTGLGTDSGHTLIATEIDTRGLRVTGISAGVSHSLLLTVPESSPLTLGCVALLGFSAVVRRRL